MRIIKPTARLAMNLAVLFWWVPVLLLVAMFAPIIALALIVVFLAAKALVRHSRTMK